MYFGNIETLTIADEGFRICATRPVKVPDENLSADVCLVKSKAEVVADKRFHDVNVHDHCRVVVTLERGLVLYGDVMDGDSLRLVGLNKLHEISVWESYVMFWYLNYETEMNIKSFTLEKSLVLILKPLLIFG